MTFETWWIWMALATLLLITEIKRAGSYFLWLSFGAAAAGILAMVEIQFPGQLFCFLNLSGILFVLERRFSEKFTLKHPKKIGAAGLLGKEGVVVETINNKARKGIIKFGEDEWRADSKTGEIIPEGTRVKLIRSPDKHGILEFEVISADPNKHAHAIFHIDGHENIPDEAQDDENIFRKSGPGWEIKYGGKSYTVKHSIGLYHIRNLIIKMGKSIHCSELKRLCGEENSDQKFEPYNSMTGEQLDGENLRFQEDITPDEVIRQVPLNKLKKFRDDLRDKIEAGDFSSPDEKIDRENMLISIEKHLNSVTNHKGKSRKLYDDADTDRKAVSAAINRCRSSLSEHKELHTHFKSFIIAEGNSFRYMPDRPIDWITR